MAAGRFIVGPYFPARNRDGVLQAGALLYVYENGTTTKATIYTDEGLSVLSANPVVANASGQFPAVWGEAGTADVPVPYTVMVTDADGGSIGNPSTFDDFYPSLNWENANITLAEAAAVAAEASADAAATSATEAATSAAEAAADLVAIEEIAAGSPDAPSIVNKANRNADNVSAYASDWRTAIGAASTAALAASGGSNLIGFIQSGTGAVANTLQAELRSMALNIEDFGARTIQPDNATYIQAAINAAVARGVGAIRVPVGSYSHSGITDSRGIYIVGDSMTGSVLLNTSDNPSIQIAYDGSNAILNGGIFNLCVRGQTSNASTQHGVVINGVSSGWRMQNVLVRSHGGDGVQVRYGSVGPYFIGLSCQLNNGHGVNLMSHDDGGFIINRTTTTARFIQCVVTLNGGDGVRLNGGDTQDVIETSMLQCILESNDGYGLRLQDGTKYNKFDVMHIEANGLGGLLSEQTGASGGQVPLYTQFCNMYFEGNTTRAIQWNAGQYTQWYGVISVGATPDAYFTNTTGAGMHEIYGWFTAPIASGGGGRSVNRIYGVLDEAFMTSATPVWQPRMMLTDGVAEPSTVSGKAQIFVDTADGDLKVKFGDGTVKTIVVDT